MQVCGRRPSPVFVIMTVLEQWHAGRHLEWGGGHWLDDGHTALLFLCTFNSKHLKRSVTLRVDGTAFCQ